jgi:hypothetical protein
VSGERTPTPTVPSTAPPRSGSWSSLVDLVAGRPQHRYVCQCMCVHVCLWFYPHLQGLDAGPHWWTLWREDHSTGMCVSACVCMYACGFIHVSKVWKLVLTGGPCGGKTTAQVCNFLVHVCAHIASGFIHRYKVWKIVLTGGPCGGKTTAQGCCFIAYECMYASGFIHSSKIWKLY